MQGRVGGVNRRLQRGADRGPRVVEEHDDLGHLVGARVGAGRHLVRVIATAATLDPTSSILPRARPVGAMTRG